MKTLYKVLEAGKSCHGGEMNWSLPNGKPGDWHMVEGNLELCKNGLHLTEKPFLWFQWNCDLFEAEYEGEILHDPDGSKSVVRKARLLRKLDPPTWWLDVHRFVEKDIPSVNWLKPDRKPKKSWKLYKGKSLGAARAAAGAAAWAAAGDAAGDAARAAALDAALDAARDAARAAALDAARGAARAAALAAALDAAWDAAWDAAGDAAWDAAGDAALIARLKIVQDLKVDKKHFIHAYERWEVWEKGYALACDINGVLYVYAKED